jgi:CheY-like chemotaxis protein
MKNPMDGTTTTTTMKGFFLATSRERVEMSMSTGAAKDQGSSIMILDHQAMKGLTLAPEQKHDMELDPSLFSLEPPAGYTVNNMDVKMPVEDDLVNVLRLIAEHNDGTFPPAIGMGNKEYQQAIQAASKSEVEKFVKEPETEKLLEELKA